MRSSAKCSGSNTYDNTSVLVVRPTAYLCPTAISFETKYKLVARHWRALGDV
jgi:hypothetical protein